MAAKIALVTTLLAILPFAPLAVAQDAPQELPEYVLKAGFLYNFAKYVDWPPGSFADPSSPIRIGIIGEDPFKEHIEQVLVHKKVGERGFVIERYKEIKDITRCHMLFIPRTEKARTEEILKKVKDWGTLTVGEDSGFAQAGGVINILVDQKRAKLEINADAAQSHKITINSKLLKVSTVVRSEK